MNKQAKPDFKDLIRMPQHSLGREKYTYIDKFYRLKEVDLTKDRKWYDWSPTSKDGAFRIAPLEGIYRRWKELSPDVRNAIIPLCNEYALI